MLGTAGSRSAWQRVFPEVEDLPVITLDLTACGECSEAEPTKAAALLSRPQGPGSPPSFLTPRFSLGVSLSGGPASILLWTPSYLNSLEPSRRMVRLEVSRVAWNHNSIQNMDCEVRLTSVESCLLLLKESSF